MVASYQYDAFGNTVAQSGTLADAFAYRFSTKYWDEEAGLYYYGYRFYRPELGRWVSRDPIGEWGSINYYSFVDNNSIMLLDYLGQFNIGTKVWVRYNTDDWLIQVKKQTCVCGEDRCKNCEKPCSWKTDPALSFRSDWMIRQAQRKFERTTVKTTWRNAVSTLWDIYYSFFVEWAPNPINAPDEIVTETGMAKGPWEENKDFKIVWENKKCDCGSKGDTQTRESIISFQNSVITPWELESSKEWTIYDE